MWSRDGGMVCLSWPDGGAEFLAIDPDNPNELNGGNGTIASTWVRQ
jgi:hypothetical protein